MTAPAITVRLDDQVGVVRDLFKSENIHHMMVVEYGKLVGILCENELLRVVSPYLNSNVYTTRDLATLNQRVHQVVKRNPPSLKPSDKVLEAIKLFNVYSVCCIPVVDEFNAPVGIVTKTNLIRYIQSTFLAEKDAQ